MPLWGEVGGKSAERKNFALVMTYRTTVGHANSCGSELLILTLIGEMYKISPSTHEASNHCRKSRVSGGKGTLSESHVESKGRVQFTSSTEKTKADSQITACWVLLE